MERGIEQSMDAILEVPSAVLVLMGFGMLEESLTEQVVRPPYLGRVLLLPPVPPEDLLVWSASADVLVMAIQPTTLNHRYTTPQKLFESMAAGVPVVASDLPGMAPIVRATGAGVVCDPTSPASIAEAISSIVTATPEERQAMRERAPGRRPRPLQLGGAARHLVRCLPRAAPRGPMNDRERIAELEAKVDQLERDEELSRLRLRDAKAAAKVQSEQIARLREEIQRLRGRRSVGFALSASARIRPLAHALAGLVAVGRRVVPAGLRSRRGRTRATASGGRQHSADLGVPIPPLIDGPATYREHLLGALGDGDRSTAEPLHIAIAGVDPARAIRTDLDQLGWHVTTLDTAEDGWTRPDTSIDVVLVLDHDLDVRRLPRRIVTVAWLGDDAADWLGGRGSTSTTS